MLRDYQEKIIEEVRQAFQDGKKSVLIQLATGGGKTLTTATMIKRTLEKGNPAWFLCHRRELINQASKAFTKLDIPHGIIAAGSYPALFRPVQICSVQTLVRRMNRLKVPPLIVYDEAHHIAAETWAKTHRYFMERGARFIGLSATPQRLDGKGLDRFFDHMVQGPSPAWLIENGYLSPFKVYAPPTSVDLSGVKSRGGDFATDELALLVDRPSITGDIVSHYLRLARGKKAIAFCVNVEHSKHLVEQFKAAGVRAVHVDGNTPDDERNASLKKFEKGEVEILSGVDLFSEGLDVPDAVVAILGRPTQSVIIHLQQPGRTLRISPGKDFAIILDHAGNCLRHGLPDDEREWSLKGKEKKKKGESEKTPPVRQCPKCYFVQKSIIPTCQGCGHVFEISAREIRHEDGQLKEITRDEAKALAAQRRRAEAYEQSMAKDLDGLVQLGISRGYKQPTAWARHVLKGRNG